MSGTRKFVELVGEIENRAHEIAVSVINDGTDALGIEVYDKDGNDLSEDEKWLDNFLQRLYNYVHSISCDNIVERDFWAIETGRAQILLNLKNILGVEIDKWEERILKWLAELFS